MTFKYTTNETFSIHYNKILALCTEKFGPEHSVTNNPITNRKIDNHGNWKVVLYSYRVSFRYEKDLMMFLLMASHLTDSSTGNTWIKRILR